MVLKHRIGPCLPSPSPWPWTNGAIAVMTFSLEVLSVLYVLPHRTFAVQLALSYLYNFCYPRIIPWIMNNFQAYQHQNICKEIENRGAKITNKGKMHCTAMEVKAENKRANDLFKHI
ncbi:hypothetical protein V6N13_144563 [Hibiscus sabdariffa]